MIICMETILPSSNLDGFLFFKISNTLLWSFDNIYITPFSSIRLEYKYEFPFAQKSKAQTGI